MIRILHTGDVHLDSPFAGLGAELSEIRRQELRATFSSMMTYARTENLDMVLIAGDMVDSGYATADTVAFIVRELSSLHCPVYVAPGNHDPADGHGLWASPLLPPNVHVFKGSALSFVTDEKTGIDVYGYGFDSPELTDAPLAGEFRRNGEKASILVAHADMSAPVSKYAPLSRAQLESFGANYAALGHVHDGTLYEGKAGKCTYAYSGCPEGRDFGECGVKGAILVELENNKPDAAVTYRRKRFCRRQYADINVNVDGAASSSDITEAVVRACGELEDKTVLRVTVNGTVDPGARADKAAIISALPAVSEVVLRDETVPTLSFSDGDLTVKGEFCRLLREGLESSDPRERAVAAEALKLGLAALEGR